MKTIEDLLTELQRQAEIKTAEAQNMVFGNDFTQGQADGLHIAINAVKNFISFNSPVIGSLPCLHQWHKYTDTVEICLKCDECREAKGQ